MHVIKKFDVIVGSAVGLKKINDSLSSFYLSNNTNWATKIMKIFVPRTEHMKGYVSVDVIPQ